MLFSKWTVYQAAALTGLIGLAVLAEFYSLDIGNALASGAISSMLIVLTFILLSTSLIHLFFVFHSKKSERFLSHPLWNKMNVLSGLVLVFSVVVFISAGMFTPLNDWITDGRWILYGILYLFLFLYSLFVLSVVHKVKQRSAKETKIEISFGATVVSLCVLLFLF
ncbi:MULTISPECIES: hypothetical protein [unclassified Planococcus (in: firmicutes)]|uniref:hypothetical protein n=1 Tax=unclassified Planococcus (in: firmicutes) TaxID=2662419 RepID=UPI000C7C5B93|nr:MULTISPECIES: hypothetical protein [unclassified Planococcus (in: firmicutes)]PKG44833.1 hypothetical protein CXF66_13445 [Planococcus sp. Urea-trap-24]PKG87175.1 hypothetical protein CXF91_14285 [Planococcus sp. Urea-3u-39]PKH40279.1 hypothetical protein CXF77_08560 [Planococcus sp. MB-3u-09]